MIKTAQVSEDAVVPRTRLATWRPDRLNDARKAKGWTIAALSAAAGLGYPTCDAYLRGRHAPDPATLVRLANELGVATTYLAPLSERPHLHELRWHAGLSVTALATQLGRSEGATSRALRGEIRITDLQSWADALGVIPAQVQAAWDTSHDALDPRH